MADQVFNVTIKGIGDFSDVVSNVNSVQKALTKLKIPEKLGNNLNQNISNFMKEYDKYQQKIAGGIKTQSDNNAVNKSLSSMLSSYQKIVNDFNKIKPKDFKEIFKLDEGAFASITNKINTIKESLKNIKIDPSQIEEPLKKISSVTRSDKIVGKDGLLNSFKEGLSVGGVDGLVQARKALTDLENHFARFGSQMSNKNTFDSWDAGLKDMRTALEGAENAAGPLLTEMGNLNNQMDATGAKGISAFNNFQQGLNNTSRSAVKVTSELKKIHEQEFDFNKQVQNIDRQIQSYFGLSQMIRKVGQIARDAFNTVKELDQAMTATAVVTNFSVGDMWNMLPTYTEQANKLGATIKDVYDAATLYYQQGLNTNQAMGLANETLKMARIAGMDAAEATDMMTSALRGFNMEINQASAQKVNDIYSQLAAVTASDTRELGTAMEKTASLANSANMDIETTSAFLAQMIETTREAPENLGTAMKTIIARFQEMKKDPTSLVDAEGVAMDVNKVDTALKSIGVQLTNSKGEFRDLDDVFLDISKRWDSLSQGQQRYIATTAAGSRQQSRFIAMMSNYDRTMELVNEANNSAGASQKQFEKTMDSMSSKLNQLKNAWNEFTMGLMNNQILKAGVTGLTQFFTVVNKIIDALGKIPPKPFEGITKSILTLGATLTGLNFAKKFARGTVMGGAAWWNNEGSFLKNFQKGYGVTKNKNYEAEANMRLQQQIQSRLSEAATSNNIVQVPVTADTYLAQIDSLELNEEVINQIKSVLSDSTVIDKPVQINTILDNAKNVGMIDQQQYERSQINIDPVTKKTTIQGVKDLANSTGKLTNNFTSFGVALQQVGSKMGPFGGILTTIGSIMVTLGTTLNALKISFLENYAAAKLSSSGIAAFGSALVTTVGPLLGMVLAIGAAIAIFKAIDAAIETDKEKIERLSNAAAGAAETYNSLKQESSELNDSLEQIQNNENAFDGLVVGTTEFNEKLIEANQAITELLNKYPELYDYLSSDENGLMHISEEGYDFIKQQQTQRTANAAAINAISQAQTKSEQVKQETDKKEEDLIVEAIDFLKEKAADRGEKEYKKQGDTDATRIASARIAAADEKGFELEKLLREGKENEIIRQAAVYDDKFKITQQDVKNGKEQEKILEKSAVQQGLITSLVGIEASDREKSAKIAMKDYDNAKKRAEESAKKATKKEMAKQYADWYGYEYEESTGKVKIGEEEKKFEEGELETAYENIVLTADLKVSAESYDKIEEEVNQSFSKGIDIKSSNSSNVLSDLLEHNTDIDPDILKKLVEDPNKIVDGIKELKEEQIATILKIDEEKVKNDPEKYRNQLKKDLTNDVKDIYNIQAEVYKDFGTILASNITDGIKLDESDIQEAVKKLNYQQVSTLTNIGQSLQENVGVDTMTAFIGRASKIYSEGSLKVKKEFDSIIKGVNWESPTARLAAYNEMIKSTTSSIQEIGRETQNSTSESNLLGDAFDEFLGGDWTELAEKADDFKNAVGEIDGAGIIKASEQSNTLKVMLDSDIASANGLALALQAVDSGKLASVSQTALQLLSNLDKLSDKALEAHNIIANFDAGIDTGESEDFVKDNAKAVQELMKNNEWGNEQLKNYIKAAAGEELWSKTLAKNKGNLKKTTKDLDQYVTKFKDGFVPAFDDIISGKGINGKSLSENIDKAVKNNDIEKSLGDKMKEIYKNWKWDDEGFLQLDFGDLTTDELEKFFQKAYGVSEEYSKLFLETLKNYDETESSRLQVNDMTRTLQNDEFRETHMGANRKVVLSGSDLIAIQEAGGDEALQKIADILDYDSISELWKNDFRTTENRERRDDYKELLDDYANAFYKDKKGQEGYEKLLGQKELVDKNGLLDMSKLTADTLLKGMDQEQSMQTAFQAYEQLTKEKDKDVSINGETLERGLSYEEFVERMESISSPDQWVQVGETIGQQIVNAFETLDFINKLENGDLVKQTAFTEDREGNGKLNEENFGQVVDKIITAASGDKERQVEDIATYLSQSKTLFDNLDVKSQAQALEGIVNQLNQFNFKPEEISAAISKGLNVPLTDGPQNLLTGKTGNVELNLEKTEAQLANLKGKVSNVEVSPAAIEEVSKNFDNITVGVQGIMGSITLGAGLPGLATGQNNPNSAFHRVGTMARGSRGGYTISGRPTLTGEEGEELVWEPKRNEAYMVGSKGPQFANISKDAVVWNADQTKRIKKNSGSVGHIGTGARGITPFGTMSGGAKIAGTGILDVMANIIGFNGLNGDKKEQGLTIDVTAVVNTLDVKEEAKTIKGLKGEITAEKVNKSGQIQGEPVKLSGTIENISINVKDKEKKDKPQKVTQTVETKVKNNAQKEIDNTKRTKGPVEIKTKASKDAQNAINKIEGKRIEIHIKPIFEGTWEKTATIKVETQKVPRKAKGQNNYIQYHSAPTFGSAAKGYGTVGPKNKGGLTLTGEKGYEIAWLPSENRSMILGVGGPQMITLPDDAVVYTHEQSKDIIKRKGIPAGSHSGLNKNNVKPKEEKKVTSTSGNNSGDNNKKKRDPKKDDKKEKANTSAISKIVVWWDNITRRADATQRKADKNQKTYEKYLKDIKATLKDTGTIGGGNDFISNTNKAINLYNDQLKQAAFELRNLTIGTEGQRNAAKTKTKKDDKKANKRAFLNEAGGAVKISYSKKSGKKKKTVNQIIDTAKYIKEQDGTYVIDQSQLNKIKNGEKRKALADALNKEINDRISKKNAAEDNIEKANEALEKFSEELYNTFFAWENELTKIWNITQKIEQAQSRMGRNDAYDELLKAQLSTGKLTAGAESRNKDLTNFRSRLESQNDLLKERQEAIIESQKNVQRILTSEDEKQTLANVNNKLNANAKATQKLNELNNAKQAKQAYDTAIKNEDTTQKSINKIQAKIIKLKDKKNLSNADKEKIKKLRKQRDELKKQKENYDKIIKDNKSLASKVNQLQLEYNNVKDDALDVTQKGAYEKYQKALTDQITAQEWGRKFVNPQMRADGTIDIQFNTEAFETARTNGEFTSDMAKAIQDWVKELQEASNNLQQSYEDLTKEVTEYYTQLDTLQQEWADYGKELTEITETYEKEKIDKIKQLSDEIKKTLDKLLNDVKRNLDERRRQQENTKTEQDISQKQQRLAALRADTSGGHQVEIAQLEKEIAEAQQNYQNSLEDQLLDKIQQQADLAAEQRERQIELQEMLVSSVSNIEKVNEWMIRAQEYSNLKEDEQNAFKEEVRAGYRSKNNYDQLTKAERDEVDTNFEEFFHGLVTNSEKQDKLNLAIGGLEGTLKTLNSYLEKQNQLAASSSNTSGGGSTGGGSTSGGNTGGGNTGGGNKTTTAATQEEARVAALRNYDKKLNDYASNGKLSGSELKKLIEAGNNSYVNKNGAAVFADLHRVGFSWDKILTAANAAKYSKKDIKTWGSSDAFKKALKSYATGGLANFTGPAWLDGTPSKPELVLNSTDTRNFIALRDVLGKVMSSNGSAENSYANAEFNININIEKVADDYDVDKIITKVKKEIIKSAGYRNVTQVRSFR